MTDVGGGYRRERTIRVGLGRVLPVIVALASLACTRRRHSPPGKETTGPSSAPSVGTPAYAPTTMPPDNGLVPPEVERARAAAKAQLYAPASGHGSRDDDTYRGLKAHFSRFFGSVEIRELVWPLTGAVATRFRVLEIPPTPKLDLWVYVSLGSWESTVPDQPRMEFALLTKERGDRPVETLHMVAFYHARQHLGLGHTMPIGEPWLPGATCDHYLVSIPYPLGPSFEVAEVGGTTVHVYWLLPITAEEKTFRHAQGLEALEQRFEQAGLEYWDLKRRSVVP